MKSGDFQGKTLSWPLLEKILSGKFEGDLAPVVPLHPTQPFAPRGFAELHAASHFHFLHGASSPEDMVHAAKTAGLAGLALLDRDGLYGAVEFAMAAEDMPTIFGAELSVDHRILPVLCKDPEGYRILSNVITEAKLRGDKDHCQYPSLPELAAQAAGHWYVLADMTWVDTFADLACFGDDVLVEYTFTMSPTDVDDHARLQALGGRGIASARPTTATAETARLAMVKQSLGRNETLDDAVAQLPPHASWIRIVGDPELQANTVAIAQECAFAFQTLKPGLPHWDVPDEMEHLRELVNQHYHERFSGDYARAQIEHELTIIAELDFPGYFLIVHDIVDFCRRNNILCQGRGSAANSAVCFVLGITNVNPVRAKLLFERFLSKERKEPPDIDIDIESTRREEVIQYVYEKYGRTHAAQVANVVSYRSRGAGRDVARVLGYPDAKNPAIAEQLYGEPRHLSIHSGGMILCDRPIADVVPVEWARKQGRSVVQWDKDSCAHAGLVKFDLLGLGMLEAIHHMLDLVAEIGKPVNLWELDLADPNIYEMLSNGDAIGVFQVESRAQLATLPRLRPQKFFDLVIEVALIRPGPIQGGAVHPYLRRRNGQEAVTYDDPLLERALGKTLGIPLFQEQIMQLAMDAANFSAGEADQLRRAMGSKRSLEKMQALRDRFFAGTAANSLACGEKLWKQIMAFATYGFPEAHAQSFAAIVYYSAWFKYYYPAQFCVGLLRAQPMGFYSPQTLLADAKRHGVQVLPIDVNASQFEATIENGAIRLGLNMVQSIAHDFSHLAPFRDIEDLSYRAGLSTKQVTALAKAGALDCFGASRRQAMWQAGVAATAQPDMLPGLSVVTAPPLPTMSMFELIASDIALTGVSDKHPMQLLRAELDTQGVLPAARLLEPSDGSRVTIAGVITHRQRPVTAEVLFLGMEDETGLMNVVITPGLEERYPIVKTARAVIVRGIIQNANEVASITADKITELTGNWVSKCSRDYR
ncbi:MAG: PHP domain-containing protein [Corynebacterium sp.]|nr:PHP domain-containing protein [Corynebacterium sp.]